MRDIICHYLSCRMRNLCKDHCVRWDLEQDGWVIDANGDLVEFVAKRDSKRQDATERQS
jgi:hypothetical protein